MEKIKERKSLKGNHKWAKPKTEAKCLVLPAPKWLAHLAGQPLGILLRDRDEITSSTHEKPT